MTKATKKQQFAISEYVVFAFCHELGKPGGSYTFGDLKDEIKAVFGDLEFNWMTVVRAPMQKLINEGYMRRDTSDLMVERYIKA